MIALQGEKRAFVQNAKKLQLKKKEGAELTGSRLGIHTRT